MHERLDGDRHSIEYVLYLQSASWKRKRRAALEAAQYRCQRCGRSGHDGPAVALDVHHLTYERLGRELPSDLKAVCRPCHEVEDAERAKRSAADAEERLYEARLDGWATKVYGEDWDMEEDREEVEERFEAWLEDRESSW
jgi:hypothetical protein